VGKANDFFIRGSRNAYFLTIYEFLLSFLDIAAPIRALEGMQ
jgi:hypothetical protein